MSYREAGALPGQSASRGFHADGRLELASGNQASQMRQPNRGRFQRQFLKQDKAIQRRPTGLAKLSDIAGDFVTPSFPTTHTPHL